MNDRDEQTTPHRQTSRRHTSPSHPQCRPLSAPARLHCVADSCTRPGTCHRRTSRIEMSFKVWNRVERCSEEEEEDKANQGDVNKDDLRVSSTLESILHESL